METESEAPRSREDRLRYSRQINLDPNTVNSCLLLSEKNRKMTQMEFLLISIMEADSLTALRFWAENRTLLGGVMEGMV